MVFDPVGNLVDELICPADLRQDITKRADSLARQLIEKMGMIDLLAVEMFLTRSGELLINEVAPRPHNIGHHTIKNTDCSQYEQLLRCLVDAPLIEGKRNSDAMMVNILGAPEGIGRPIYNGIDKVMSTPGIHLYLYGKSESRPFRKMGHFTITGKNRLELIEKAEIIKQNFFVTCEK
jgi:5-(carboxyamino)imidazole ribonucleotide synthase